MSPEAPSAWDVLRAFVDAGWLEMTALRNVPAKQFVLRQLALMPVGSNKSVLVGPTPLAVLDRLERTAAASGVELEQRSSASPYGLPMYFLQANQEEAMTEFRLRSQLPLANVGKRKAGLAESAENLSLEGHSCVASFNSRSGYFDPHEAPAENGLYRYEHSSGSSRLLYVSRRAGFTEANFSTLAVALLHHHSDEALFSYSEHLVQPRARRIRLPATWARWLAVGTGANPGPMKLEGLWSYGYPADSRAARMLAGTIPLAIPPGGPPKWVLHAVNSDGAESRKLFVGNTLTSRRHGGVLR